MFKLFANVPNLNGIYEGHLKSDNDEQEIEEYKPTDDELDKTTVGKNLKVTITHTLSNIKVEIDFYNLKEKTKSSHSESISHYLKTTDNGIYELTYEYVNTKNGDHKHKDKWRDTEIKGFTRLRYKPSTKTFEGEYFNLDIKNPRSGQINLSLKQS